MLEIFVASQDSGCGLFPQTVLEETVLDDALLGMIIVKFMG